MRPPVLVDAGPIVAYLDESEPYHAWAKEQFAARSLPLLTCEPALAEAAYLIARGGSSLGTFFELLISGSVVPRFELRRHAPRLRAMIEQYRNVPMDLTDACLVRMAERHEGASVLTLDSDFYIYRLESGAALDVISPS